MKIRSAKAKGRRACQQFVDALLYEFPTLCPEDLEEQIPILVFKKKQ